mgnify:FL=1
MKTKMFTALAAAGLCTAMAFAAFADGAPASQFGFSGWPYRQETDCTPRQTACPTATSEPVSTPKPAATVQPPVVPSEPTRCPIQEPVLTQEPAPTAAPTRAPVISPVQTPEATAAPTETPAPTSVPTKRPTQQPVPTVAETPAPTKNPVIATPSPSTGNDYTTGSITAQEENAFLLLNQDRAANGRSALTLDPSLCALARLKSQDMNANHYFAHTSPTLGSAAEMLRNHGYAFTSVGENIAHHATVAKAQAAFMSSTGHRTNILGSQWTKVGIGVCSDSQGYVYVTQLFVR